MALLEYSFLGNTLQQYLLAFLAFLLILIFILFAVKRIKQGLDTLIKMGRKQKAKDHKMFFLLLKLIRNTPGYFLWIFSVYIPLNFLHLDQTFSLMLDIVFSVVLVVQLIRITDAILEYAIALIFIPQDQKDETTQNIIALVVKILLWIIGITVLLTNFGIEITPLLASLGIGGIAVAFAFKSILEDIFASFSILLSKPFKVGDYVDIGGEAGTVREIGFKATRIHTLRGEDLVLPNKKVVESTISNFANVKRRRMKVTLGIIYETKPSLLRKIPDIVQSVIDSVENTEFVWTVFKEYNAYSLDFEVVYYINVASMKEHLQILQEVNYRIFEAFAEHGIEFAYPTQMTVTQKSL